MAIAGNTSYADSKTTKDINGSYPNGTVGGNIFNKYNNTIHKLRKLVKTVITFIKSNSQMTSDPDCQKLLQILEAISTALKSIYKSEKVGNIKTKVSAVSNAIRNISSGMPADVARNHYLKVIGRFPQLDQQVQNSNMRSFIPKATRAISDPNSASAQLSTVLAILQAILDAANFQKQQEAAAAQETAKKAAQAAQDDNAIKTAAIKTAKDAAEQTKKLVSLANNLAIQANSNVPTAMNEARKTNDQEIIKTVAAAQLAANQANSAAQSVTSNANAAQSNANAASNAQNSEAAQKFADQAVQNLTEANQSFENVNLYAGTAAEKLKLSNQMILDKVKIEQTNEQEARKKQNESAQSSANSASNAANAADGAAQNSANSANLVDEEIKKIHDFINDVAYFHQRCVNSSKKINKQVYIDSTANNVKIATNLSNANAQQSEIARNYAKAARSFADKALSAAKNGADSAKKALMASSIKDAENYAKEADDYATTARANSREALAYVSKVDEVLKTVMTAAKKIKEQTDRARETSVIADKEAYELTRTSN